MVMFSLAMEKFTAGLTNKTLLDIYIHTHTLSDCVAELNTKNWQLSMTIKNGDFPN